MWTILEEREAAKVLTQLPPQVAEKYAFWCAIVRQSGPVGLRTIKSFHDENFHDEKLSGRLARMRSSRLSQQWRVLYRVRAEEVTVYVERVTPTTDRREGDQPMASKIKKTKATAYVAARTRVVLAAGDSVRIARDLLEMTQADLAAASGIAQSTISSIESGREGVPIDHVRSRTSTSKSAVHSRSADSLVVRPSIHKRGATHEARWKHDSHHRRYQRDWS